MTHPLARCAECGHPLRSQAHYLSCHVHDDTPVTCVCEDPDPDGIGECRKCHRKAIRDMAEGLDIAEVRARLRVLDPVTDMPDPFVGSWSYTWDEPA